MDRLRPLISSFCGICYFQMCMSSLRTQERNYAHRIYSKNFPIFISDIANLQHFCSPEITVTYQIPLTFYMFASQQGVSYLVIIGLFIRRL